MAIPIAVDLPPEIGPEAELGLLGLTLPPWPESGPEAIPSYCTSTWTETYI